jgi:hypothetical protein
VGFELEGDERARVLTKNIFHGIEVSRLHLPPLLPPISRVQASIFD